MTRSLTDAQAAKYNELTNAYTLFNAMACVYALCSKEVSRKLVTMPQHAHLKPADVVNLIAFRVAIQLNDGFGVTVADAHACTTIALSAFKTSVRRLRLNGYLQRYTLTPPMRLMLAPDGRQLLRAYNSELVHMANALQQRIGIDNWE